MNHILLPALVLNLLKDFLERSKPLFLLLISTQYLCALDDQQRKCIILLDRNDSENIGTARWFLMSRVQSAIAEKSTPLLISASLWNSFIERKITFQQQLAQKSGSLYEIYNLYQEINKSMEHASHHYNALSCDASHNKNLVVQCINKDFYNNTKNISGTDYQFLLTHYTDFDPQDWDIYKNNGFYLLIPKKYSAQYAISGFKLDTLERVTNTADNGSAYFESRIQQSIADALPNFFLTHNDFTNEAMPYSWNIIFSGHGGSQYKEINDNGVVNWSGEPIIADLTTCEFADVLTFFNNHVSTRFFHYSTCYGAGNHIALMFNNDNRYNFAIMCDSLTDCATYCKWVTMLPSSEKRFLTIADVAYDKAKNCWQLPLAPVYFWDKFFNDINSIDFSVGSIKKLQEIMSSVQYTAIANIPLLCLPGTNNFFPLQDATTVKIDDALLALANSENENLTLNDVQTVLVESSFIIPTMILNHLEPLRIVSIKPDNAVHYMKKLEFTYYVDLPSAFWQAQYQHYNKIFIIDECIFPRLYNIQDSMTSSKDPIKLTNVIITIQKHQCMRILFTLDDTPMMVIAHKPIEESDYATIQEVITMTTEAQDKYEHYYTALKNTALQQ